MRERTVTLTIFVLAGMALTGLCVAAFVYLDQSRANDAEPPTSANATSTPRPLDNLDLKADQVRRATRPDGLLALALARYKLRAGAYPENLHALLERPEDLADDRSWDGPYIHNPDLLLDPWGNPYAYRYPSFNAADSYDLWSSGPDGEPDTADDIGNPY